MMEVLRHSLVSGGSLGRLPHSSNDVGAGGGGGGGGDSNSHNVGGVSSQTTLNSPLSDSTSGNLTLRSPADIPGGGGGGGAGFYSEPDDFKSDDASSVASGFTSADSSAPIDPSSVSKDR